MTFKVLLVAYSVMLPNNLAAEPKGADIYPLDRIEIVDIDRVVMTKQDKLSMEKALAARTYQALQHYVDSCYSTGCLNLSKIEQKLEAADKVRTDFEFHLRARNLSRGSKGYALQDIERYKKILPNDPQVEQWQDQIGEAFLLLAINAKEQDKLSQADKYTAKAEQILGKNKAEIFVAILEKNPAARPTSDQDKSQEIVQIKSALLDGDINLIMNYIVSCKNCLLRPEASEKLKRYESIVGDFLENIENDRLTKGQNNASKNLKELKEIFPQTKETNSWSQKIADRFYQLAEQETDQIKALLYRKSGRKFVTTAQKATPNPMGIEQNLLNGNIAGIKEYIKNCVECPHGDKALAKLESYAALSRRFTANIANDRLTKGQDNASKNLKELKEIFPQTREADSWSQKIAGRFNQLASKTADPKQALLYLDKALKFAQNKSGLKYSKAGKYKKVMSAQTIAAAKEYIEICKPSECLNYSKIKKMLAEAERIKNDFARHLENNALTKGGRGYAMEDVSRLRELFPKDPLLASWRSQVVNKFLKLIDNSFQRKNYAKARQYLASALAIQKKHPGLKSRLDQLQKLGPGHNLYSKDTKLVPAMAYLPGKVFSMGGKFRRSKPEREVVIRPFKMSRHEITFAKYKLFAKAKGIKINSSDWGTKNRPAINVSWHDAVNYTKWLSNKTGRKFRLPSEAEWEYAASNITILTNKNLKLNRAKICLYGNGADIGSKYPWKNGICNDGYKNSAAPVASYRPNSFGLYDMHGNVWEWTYDCWHYNFKGAPQTAKPWIRNGDCRYRVIKGGGWNSSVDFMLPKYRTSAKASIRYNYIGFRIVEEL